MDSFSASGMARKLHPCPSCGARVPSEDASCPHCGASLTAGASAGPGPAPSGRSGAGLRDAASEVREAIVSREADDVITWRYSLVLPLIVGVAAFLSSFLVDFFVDAAAVAQALRFALVLVSLVTEAWFGVVVYRFIRGNNRHFRREVRLEKALVRFLEHVPGSPHSVPDSGRSVAWLSSRVASPANRTKERSPVAFVMLVVVLPIVLSFTWAYVELADSPEPEIGLLTLYLVVTFGGSLALMIVAIVLMVRLTEDISGHNRRWSEFTDVFRVSLAKAGYVSASLRTDPGPRPSSSALYVVLTFITGVFFIYWFYAMTKDMNHHLKAHRRFEDELLIVVQGLSSPGGAPLKAMA